MKNRTFSPDWISSPGESIEARLEELGWSQAEFAERTDFAAEHVDELLQGRAAITADTADRLAVALGGTAAFWLTREANYRAALADRDAH